MTKVREFNSMKDKRVYSGNPIECGGTSIQGGVAPALAEMYARGVFSGAKSIIDYGAGRYARNANYLREKGFRVYAYDPNHGTDVDGYIGISNKLPNRRFDVGFTSFVLNVVPEYIEREIVSQLSELSRKSFHITRNRDVFDSVKKSLLRADDTVSAFFLNHFATKKEASMLARGDIPDSVILAFCEHGVQTTRGFQRIPSAGQIADNMMEIKSTSAWKIYGDRHVREDISRKSLAKSGKHSLVSP